MAHGMSARIGSSDYQAFLFDLDGVVTDTARLHAQAWRTLFDDILREAGQPALTERDYRDHIDGRSRIDGVAGLLAARGIDLPRGKPDDPPSARTVHGLAAHKDELFLQVLAEQPAPVFASTVTLLRRLRAGRVPTALVTASRNAERVLTSAGVEDLFDARVDGVVADRDGLPGKPDPAIFLAAARMLGVERSQAVVVEDAVAGVQAAKAGGFGLVVGVDRGGQAEQLLANGAQRVVHDLSDLSVAVTDVDCSLCAAPVSQWVLDYLDPEPDRTGAREALLTLGNGYLATRGCAPEAAADAGHYAGTYVAGVYNRLVSEVDGQPREDESLVNLPNWLPLTFRPQGGTWFAPGSADALHDHVRLDLRRGVLDRDAVVRDAEGRRTRLRQRRLVSMAEPHLAALRTTLRAENWSGRISVLSALDGAVRNTNVASFAGLADRHIAGVKAGHAGADTMWLTAETTESKIRVALAARTLVRRGSQPVRVQRKRREGTDTAGQELTCAIGPGEEIVVDKLVAVHTSRDRGIFEPRGATESAVTCCASFDALAESHAAAWQRLWERFELRLTDGQGSRAAVNLHTFHLLQTLSPHSCDIDVGVPARGLHGEGYRGHIFWDELFVLPYLTLRLPELSRSLLLYRYRRLHKARELAAGLGLDGALFPWQSGSEGREETPTSFYNPRSGRWMADHSRLQYHVGLAVAYNVWHYWETTADQGFLEAYGAEMLIEVARFWASIATYDSAADRYDIRGVMGPDEFHDGYPDQPGRGIDNSAYVNVMTAWVLRRAVDACRLLGRGDEAELAVWEHVSSRLRLCFMDNDTPPTTHPPRTPPALLAQFERYEQLAELDWDGYRARYGDIGRLDLILEAEGDSTNRYRASKQADVLMLLYLFTADELTELIRGLGYDFDPATIPATVDYYLTRTSHGSTLSRVAHAWVLARTDRRRSWQMLGEALTADLADTQGTTGEGIHLGAVAGTLDILQRCYTGLDTRDGTLWLHPVLPDELDALEFDIRYRNHWLTVRVDPRELTLTAEPGHAAAIDVNVAGKPYQLAGGTTLRVSLQSAVLKS